MKLLFIITSLDNGGAEISLLRLIKGISLKTCYEIEVLCLTNPTDDLYKKFQNICTINFFDLKNNIFPNLFRLIRYVRKFQPDLIHSHMVHSNLIAALLKLVVVKAKLICTAHSTNEGKFSFFYPMISHIADFCTHVSRNALEDYVKKSYFVRNKSLYLPNPIPQVNLPPRTKPICSDLSLNFFCIGRLVALKNYDIVIRAAQLASSHRSNFTISIIGSGPEDARLKSLADNLGISEKVNFLGYREDVDSLIMNMDCLIIASSYEGLPTVLLESLQQGKMFITTDVGDCGLIAKECAGSIILNDLSAEQLSTAMLEVLAEFTARHHDISIVNKQYFKSNFEAKKVVCSFLLLYKRVMA